MKARFLALAALVLGLASCQTEPEGLDVNVGGAVDTTITVSIPETETRYGENSNSAGSVFTNGILDAKDATMRYIFQVYYNNGDQIVESQAVPQVKYSDETSVNFDVRLVPNRNYTFVVWADVVKTDQQGNWADLHYNTRNDEGKITLNNITVNEDKWVAMDESRDAFTVAEPITNYTGKSIINLELKRPFAKLRVITTDMEVLNDLQIAPAYAKVEYTTPYRAGFNAVTSKAFEAEETDKITHRYEIKTYGDNVNDYSKVLFTDYFFANDAQDDEVNFVLSVYEDEQMHNLIKSNNFNTAIPARRNYLTTISGNILTDGNNVKVDVKDAFENAGNLEDEPYYVEIWDGESIEKPELVTDPTTGEDYYSVENGSELAWLAAAVNGTLPAETYATRAAIYNFEGKTFVLTQDIDLGGNAWTPISMSTDLAGGKTFRGTFDGNGHTIKGLYVRQQEAAGLFGYVYAATIKNVTIEGANLYSNHYAGGVVAWVLNNKGNIKAPFVMENCYVKNSTISSTPAQINGEWDNGDKVGGLVGYVLFDNEGAVIKNCSVENTSIKAYRDFGGFAGYAKGVAFENCDISNVTLEQDLTHDYQAPNTPTTYGLYIGRNEGGNTFNGAEMVANGVLKTGENEYGIYGAQGLKWIADVVNATTPYTATLFDNATVELMNDIDLNNQEWIPIGDDRSQRTEWHGVFDGKGHKVKNIKITKKTDRDDESKSSYGLFGNVKGTVKNLTVENVSISGAPKFIGALIGRLNGGLVENCHVKNSSVECENWTIGGLVGQFNNGKISGCTVENTTVKGYAAVGGITGIALDKGERIIENCSINGCTFVKNGSFGGDYDKMFGTIVGALYNGGLTVNLNNCTSSNNTLDGNAYSIPCGFIANGDTLLVDGGVYIADGLTYKTADKAYYVTNANGLVYLSNNGLKAGETVKLGADIDLTGVEFNGLNTFHPENGTTFDGQNYTVSNWTNNTGASDMGFIRNWVGPIKNVKFENCHLKTNGRSAIAAAKVYGNIENVTINNCSIEDSYWACGLVAGLYNDGNISNCTVTNSTVKSNGGTGAIVGVINESAGTRKVETCKVEGCTVNNTGAYGEAYSGALICGMINISNSTVEFNGCSYKDNTKLGEYVGDLYYSADTDITVKIDGGIVVNTVEEFTAALKDANVNAIVLGQDITVTEKWDNRYTGAKTSNAITIDGNGNTLKFACEVSDGFNYQAAFRFEAPAVVKNLTIDMSEVTGTGSWLRAISTKGDITVDNCTFIGSTNYTSGRGIAYGEGADAAAGDIVVSVTNSTFTNWTRRGLTDNENAQDAKNVTVTNNTFDNADCYVSAHDSITFTGNTMNNSAANFRTYSNATDATVVATDNTLDANNDNNVIRGFVATNVTSQEGFTIM